MSDVKNFGKVKSENTQLIAANAKLKEQVLINLITKLKVYECPIVLCGHYAVNPEIVKLADYFLYIQNNDLLYNTDYNEYGVHSDRWTDLGSYKVINKQICLKA